MENGDKNCALYSLNFLDGIGKLLEDPEQHIYTLAQQIDTGSEEVKTEASNALIQIFKEDLKKYLPQYYDDTGNLKSAEAIKEYHLKQRWDMGSRFIKTLDKTPLEAQEDQSCSAM